jgi:hypothetical protein
MKKLRFLYKKKEKNSFVSVHQNSKCLILDGTTEILAVNSCYRLITRREKIACISRE